MEQPSLGYESLEQITYRALDIMDRGEDSFRKAYNLGIKGYREMMMDVAGPISVAVLTVLANKTAKLPADFSNKYRIGIPNSSTGELSAFTNNEELSTVNIENIDRLSNPGLDVYEGDQLITPNTVAKDVFFPYFDYRSFGIGSINDIGQYKIDKVAGYVVFDPNFKYSKVVLEYAADQNKFPGDYMIDMNASQAVEDYIIWKFNWTKKDVPLSEKIIQRREYYNQKRLARRRMHPITFQDINDAARKHTMGAPKA